MTLLPFEYLGEGSDTSGSEHFDRLRAGLAKDASVRSEIEAAMRLNVDRVNPSDPGNRFVVGGAVEWLIAAAAWALGVLTIPGGHSTRGFDLMDLQDAARGLWSVKAQTSANKGSFRLTNGLGGSGKGFQDPTVFVSPHLPGLVFIDPARHKDAAEAVRVKPDAVELPFAAVAKHAQRHPECVAVIAAPKNEGRGAENPFLAYAETIATPDRFPRLATMFTAAKPATSGRAAEVAELLSLKQSGAISDAQFNALVNQVAGL
ncbi:hypothetical protein OVA14_05535 [Agrococcus sp. SL85]|uniref:hypothetical protein n=1 Tax=Agrococcus sp. SL85 TaxID=2995141 RepID=UPI00226D31EF|nr:hypothetical protein [Agrococcus sp. SL85]WAC67205.1 hypothetical protein OVA14_05535 [Agrococcus sp. SL85]